MKLKFRRAAITAQALAGYGIDAFIVRCEPNEDLTKTRQLWSCKDSSTAFRALSVSKDTSQTHGRHSAAIQHRLCSRRGRALRRVRSIAPRSPLSGTHPQLRAG